MHYYHVVWADHARPNPRCRWAFVQASLDLAEIMAEWGAGRYVEAESIYCHLVDGVNVIHALEPVDLARADVARIAKSWTPFREMEGAS